MIGRQGILQRMMRALTKPIPDHLQVVGPRFSGKTVILHALVKKLQQTEDFYAAVMFWDLGHQTPGTDELFMQGLARKLASGLRVNHPVYAGFLNNEAQDNPFQEISEVLRALKEDGCKVLVVMDGFDKPLSNGQLTRNLWDQLRALAEKSSLRLVTASRRRLGELIRHPDAQTSDFFNIITETVRVGCFDGNDLSAVLEEIPELQFTTGARTEIWNASNGSPILTLSILNEICGRNKEGEVTPESIKAACDGAFCALRDILGQLWIDCSSGSQDILLRILEERKISSDGISFDDVDVLLGSGFIHRDPASNNLQRPCSLIQKYLEEQPHEGNALARLFNTTDVYKKNLKDVFKRRIGQISEIDSTLKHYLERGIGDLPDHPDVFLTNVRGIVDRAFDLIWKAEIPEKRIPSEWITLWESNSNRGEQWIDELKTSFPQGVRRVQLLNLMTGTKKSAPCAKHVTKGTYVLMNAVHAFGDFGQHQEGASIDSGTAYAALHLCVELAAALARELP
jgi:hypothetical protein